MNNVVRFNKTKRKLDWQQEEQLKDGKKRDVSRREQRKTGRDNKFYNQGDDE